MSSDTSQQPRLGPAWRSTSSGGRGFQPPSAASEPDPSSSGEAKMSTNRNSFSLLNDDDDGHGHSGPSSRSKKSNGSRSNNGNVNVNSSPKRGGFTSRSEGLRSAGLGSGGFASRSASKGGGTGRSLADLVSRFPSSDRDRGEGRSNSNTRSGTSTSASARHSARTEDSSGAGMGMNLGVGERTSGHGHGAPRSSSMSNFVDDKKVIRFTRERLLSMRPRTEKDAVRPKVLDVLDGSALLSSEPLDPGKCVDSSKYLYMLAFYVNREM